MSELTPEILEDRGFGGGRLLCFDELPSTNAWALADAEQCRHGDVVWARRQSAGRGRYGRTWIAPSDRGLAFSIVLREPFPNLPDVNVGQAAALAVQQALGHYGIEAALKWPNDVLVNDWKIAGILCEQNPGRGVLVVGVGLNVNLSDADFAGQELMQPATSILIESGEAQNVELVLTQVLKQFAAVCGEGLTGLLAAWRACDALESRAVEVDLGKGDCLRGISCGLDATGALQVRAEGGQMHVLHAGDVTRLGSLGGTA